VPIMHTIKEHPVFMPARASGLLIHPSQKVWGRAMVELWRWEYCSGLPKQADHQSTLLRKCQEGPNMRLRGGWCSGSPRRVDQ